MQEDDFITVDELADKVNLSKRSLRYLLDEVDDILSKNLLGQITRVQNRGIRIQSLDKKSIKDMIVFNYTYYQVLDFSILEDRQLFLLFLLLCSQDKINIDSLADKMDVSVRTISNDMNVLRKSLHKLDVALLFDKKSGYTITGNLFVVRNKFISELQHEYPLHHMKEMMFVLHGFFHLNQENIQIMQEADLLTIKRLLDDILPGNFVEDTKETIMLYLIITFLYQKNKSHTIASQDKFVFSESYNYDLARILRVKIEQALSVQIGEEEDYYLTILLHSFSGNELSNFEQDYPFELEVITQKLIQLVNEDQNYQFHLDTELFYIIVQHLIPLIYRIQFNCQITNPLLYMIQNRYQKLHHSVVKALQVVEDFVAAPVSEDECSFFTLYFASSIEKLMDQKTKKVDVVIVCNSGNAISRLLQYKLINAFNVNVVEVLSEKKLYEWLMDHSINLIIGVVDIDQERLMSIPYIKISAFMQEQDYEKLSIYLDKRFTLEEDVDDFQRAPLLELLRPECFLIQQSVKDIDELIGLSGSLLEKQGYCDTEYVQQMIDVAHRFHALTHIMIAPGMLLPHAGLSSHVYHAGFSFVRIKDELIIEGRSIHCAIALCTTDKQIHQKAIQQLGILLNHSQFLNEMKQIETYEAFAGLVTSCLNICVN